MECAAIRALFCWEEAAYNRIGTSIDRFLAWRESAKTLARLMPPTAFDEDSPYLEYSVEHDPEPVKGGAEVSERRIWKFPVPVRGEFVLRMPAGACVLSVQTQGNEPMLWALVDPKADIEERRFCVEGTGHPFDHDGKYLGTFQMAGGFLVWHLFEVGK